MTDLTGAIWRKSTRSGGNGGECVEVATNLPGIVAVRDSKDAAGSVLTFDRDAWRRALAAVPTAVASRVASDQGAAIGPPTKRTQDQIGGHRHRS